MTDMEMTPVNSSNVRSYGYDEDTQVLVIEFVDGNRYAYTDVPADVAAGMGTAESPGKYLRLSIMGKYDSEKLKR